MSIIIHRMNNPGINPEHVLFYLPDKIKSLLKRYGFKIKKFTYAHYPFKKLL